MNLSPRSAGRAGAALATLACTSALLLAAPAVAQADAASQHGRVNKSCGPEKFNVNDLIDHQLRDQRPTGKGASVDLSRGYHLDYGWVYWAHVANAPRNSTVWLNWSDNHGRTWHECGRPRVDGSQGPHDRWTWGVNWVHGRTFQACAQVPGRAHTCTPFES
ncbi:hypothetical protein ACPC54_27170 [Kitasatospora sp. NPDC094028]